jgi:nucleoside-diphosphate-sugar epimerase
VKILVTGGAGYVGSTLTRLLLESGYQVRVFDSLMHSGESLLGVWTHPGFEFIKGDLRDAAAIKAAVKDVDAVVHLAAIVGDPACAKEPELARAINLGCSLSLIEECKRAGVARFVFASTCSNYGRMDDPNSYVDENSELRPVSLYAETKVAVERAILADDSSDQFCPTALRSATVYGVSPRMRFDLTVNEFTMEMLTAKHLVVFGEQFWRPYIHVRDFGRAIKLVLESPAEKVCRQVFNIGATDQNYQKQQLVEMIQPFAPEARVEYVHKNEDPRDYRVSFEKIKQHLGFTITRTVTDGIKEVSDVITSGLINDFGNQKYRN